MVALFVPRCGIRAVFLSQFYYGIRMCFNGINHPSDHQRGLFFGNIRNKNYVYFMHDYSESQMVQMNHG